MCKVSVEEGWVFMYGLASFSVPGHQSESMGWACSARAATVWFEVAPRDDTRDFVSWPTFVGRMPLVKSWRKKQREGDTFEFVGVGRVCVVQVCVCVCVCARACV